MASADARTGTDREAGMPIVDCDLHIPTDGAAIRDRMPEPFRSKGIGGAGDGYSSPIGVTRRDAASSDLSAFERTRAQVLDPLGIERAIITGGPSSTLVAHPNARKAVAIMHAYNDWVLEEWTARDDRISASIAIVPHAPEESAAEIRRLADHPDMVQIITGTGTRIPFGQEDYWPIFEAAAEVGLPMAMHIGPKGATGISNPNNPAGISSNYSEGHIAQSINCYGQIASLVLEGVFESFPELTFVMIEGEFGWVPDLMWRMDRYWEAIGEQTPWLDRPPSEYLLDHVRFTTQPIPEPPRIEYFHALLEMVHAEETLMFCTDYPHWDGDYSPRQVFPSLDPALERAIFYETANAVYGFA